MFENDIEKISSECNYDFDKINKIQYELFKKFVDENINVNVEFWFNSPSEDKSYLESHIIQFYKDDAIPVKNFDKKEYEFFTGVNYMKSKPTSNIFKTENEHKIFKTREEAIIFWNELNNK